MQAVDSRISKEVDDLVSAGQRIYRVVSSASRSVGGDDLAEVAMWVTRLGHLIRKLYGEHSQYFEAYERALAAPNFYNLHNNYYEHFTQVYGVVKAIQHDISTGLLADFKTLVRAEVFSNFLEMGEHLLDEGYKDAAAVIIGSVLEDGLRKLSENAGLPLQAESGKPLAMDALNTQLAKADVYSKLVQKQLTSWAHVRNKAAHGEYDEYTREQVQMMLLFAQSFSSEHLG